MQLRMIAGGGGGGLTIQQPENNIVRGAYYALASALSGTQTMALCSYDEAYTHPERARGAALAAHDADPHARDRRVRHRGSAGRLLVRRDHDQRDGEAHRRPHGATSSSRGGIVQAVAEGIVQAEVNRQAYEREKRIRSGEVKKVGVNCFVEEEEEQEVEIHPYREEEAADVQVERLERVRRERDGTAVEAALGRGARGGRAGT